LKIQLLNTSIISHTLNKPKMAALTQFNTKWETDRKTTLVLMPPKELWLNFVEIKKNHMNPKITRPPYPHVSILAPFVPEKDFDSARTTLVELLKSVKPFKITFDEFKLFKNKKSSTLYIDPKPATDIVKVFDLVKDVFPKSHRGSVVPHIGVGYFKDLTLAQTLRDKYQAHWEPMSFEVQELYVLSRNDVDPWVIREVIPLGYSGGHVKEPLVAVGETTLL